MLLKSYCDYFLYVQNNKQRYEKYLKMKIKIKFKIIMYNMINILDGINTRLETTEKRLVNLKDRKENFKNRMEKINKNKN